MRWWGGPDDLRRQGDGGVAAFAPSRRYSLGSTRQSRSYSVELTSNLGNFDLELGRIVGIDDQRRKRQIVVERRGVDRRDAGAVGRCSERGLGDEVADVARRERHLAFDAHPFAAEHDETEDADGDGKNQRQLDRRRPASRAEEPPRCGAQLRAPVFVCASAIGSALDPEDLRRGHQHRPIAETAPVEPEDSAVDRPLVHDGEQHDFAARPRRIGRRVLQGAVGVELGQIRGDGGRRIPAAVVSWTMTFAQVNNDGN